MCYDGTTVIVPRWHQVRTCSLLQDHFVFNLLHEFGHAYWAKHEARLQRAGVSEVFGDMNESYPPDLELLCWGAAGWLGYQRPGFISAYAISHPEEDFADTFAEVVQLLAAERYPAVADSVVQQKMEFIVGCLFQ